MKRTNGWLQSSIAGLVFLALFGANAALWQSPLLGGVLLFVFALAGSLRLAALMCGDGSAEDHVWFGLALLASGLMAGGGIVYYAFGLTPIVSQSLVALAFALPLLIRPTHPNLLARLHAWTQTRRDAVPAAATFAFVAGLAFVLLALRLIAADATTEPVRSLWAAVSPGALVAFFVAALLLAGLLLRGRPRLLGTTLASLLLFVVFSASVLAFPLGFGFDPHLHQATEAHVALHGTIDPKPPYYAGQYALVVILNQAFHLPIRATDAWLLPVLAALLLPAAAYGAGLRLLRSRRAALFAVAAVFLVPLSPFVATTPQGLGNLWLILLVLASLPRLLGEPRPPAWTLVLLTAAALLVHPIAGIPAAVYLAFVLLNPMQAHGTRALPARILTGLVAAAGALALPLSFAFNAMRSGAGAGLDLSALTPGAVLSSLNLSLFLETRFDPLLDFAYLYGFNALALTLFLSGYALWRFRAGTARLLLPAFLAAAVTLTNYLILSTAVDFSFLVDYERGNYAQRLLPILAYFLLPAVMLALGHLAARLETAALPLRAFAAVLLAAVVTSGFYLAYPRDDAYGRGRGFNTGADDLAAVHAVESHAAGLPYAALANQAVSAAAVRELGFRRYWGDLFFYPIPTGGDLYGQFLAMNEAPSRAVAERSVDILVEHCRDCAGPRRIYFLVNDYWWEAPRIVETAKTQADGWFAVGSVHVFWWAIE